MSTTHAGNVQPYLDLEEHDGVLNAKKVNVVAGTITASSQVTVQPLAAWPDPHTYIGLVTITGSLAAAAGNVTLDAGSKTGIVGSVTLADSKGFIGLVSVGGGKINIQAGGTDLSQSGGNLLVNVQNFGIGQFGNTDDNAADTTSALAFVDNLVFDGTNWDRMRTADAANATTGIGTLGAGVLGYDGTNYRRLITGTDGRLQGNVTINNAVALAAGAAFLGIVTVANPSSFTGNVTLDPGSKTGIAGNVTLSDSKAFIGLVTLGGGTAWADPHGYIGLVTITGSLAAAAGNVTLDGGSITQIRDGADPVMKASIASVADGTYLGVRMRGNSTILVGNIPAVTVNAGAAYVGLATVDIGTTKAWADPHTYLGLVTATLGASPAFVGIVTVANPSSFTGNVTLDGGSLTQLRDGSDPVMKASIASVADGTYLAVRMRGNSTVVLGSGVGGIGFATVAIGTNVNTNIGLVTVSGGQIGLVGNNTVVLGSGVGNIGFATILGGQVGLIGNNTVVLGSSVGKIGFATVIYAPPPISTYTSMCTVFSASGNASLFAPPAGTRFVLKDLIVSSLGRAEVNFKSNDAVLIPYISLSTTSGFHFPFGEAGLAAKAADHIFALTLNGGATITVIANCRFE